MLPEELIEQVLDKQESLTNWEKKFSSDCDGLVKSGKDLSINQLRSLQGILESIQKGFKVVDEEKIIIAQAIINSSLNILHGGDETKFVEEIAVMEAGTKKLSKAQRSWWYKIENRWNKKAI